MPKYTFDQPMFVTVEITATDESTARERLAQILADLNGIFRGLDSYLTDGSFMSLSSDDGEADLIEINC